MHHRPLFVHCCHCTRCQRETGGPFAHHAMMEFSRFSVLQGEPEFVLGPTDSGGRHWVARCPTCRTAMWNDASKTWPEASRARYAAAKEARAASAATRRRPPRSASRST
jgi:hypothetical protein